MYRWIIHGYCIILFKFQSNLKIEIDNLRIRFHVNPQKSISLNRSKPQQSTAPHILLLISKVIINIPCHHIQLTSNNPNQQSPTTTSQLQLGNRQSINTTTTTLQSRSYLHSYNTALVSLHISNISSHSQGSHVCDNTIGKPSNNSTTIYFSLR